MAGWHKRERPVDRAARELDQKLASVRRESQQLSDPTATPAATPSASSPGHGERRVAVTGGNGEGLTAFLRGMLQPARKEVPVTYRSRRDLFDVADRAVTQLELDPLTRPAAPEPDLFTAPAQTTAGAATSSTQLPHDRLVARGTKLMDYLCAGSIRTYKPLRRVQRQERNRFFAWMGVAVAAVWLIWVIVR